jgi:hypothetical protein
VLVRLEIKHHPTNEGFQHGIAEAAEEERRGCPLSSFERESIGDDATKTVREGEREVAEGIAPSPLPLFASSSSLEWNGVGGVDPGEEAYSKRR